MLDILKNFTIAILKLLRLPLYIISLFLLVVFVLILLNVILQLIKGKRFKKGVHVKIKKSV